MTQTKYWKAFRVGELFERTSNALGIPKKELDISLIKKNSTDVALISESKENNGISGYIKKEDTKISDRDKLTISDQFVFCFYQNEEFTTTTSHLNTLIFNNDALWKKMEISEKNFFASYLTLILNTKFHNYNRKICTGNDFSREIILLPVIQCSEKDAIWTEDDGTFITLDIDKISEIMEKVEVNKRKKTIDLYEASKAKYELEKAKYDEDKEFLEEKKKIYYKAFRVGELIKLNSSHTISESAKEILISNKKSDDFCIENCGMTSSNNGVVNYVQDIGSVITKKKINAMSVATGGNGTAGAFFYHENYFCSTGNNSFVDITNSGLKEQLEQNKDAYRFFAMVLTKAFKNTFHSFARRITTGNDFSREIILLPVYDEDSKTEFSTKMMGYLYLLSRIKYWDNKINKYNTKIEELS